MASARSTILTTRSMFSGNIGRCSAQVIVLGGLMALPGALITGLGYANYHVGYVLHWHCLNLGLDSDDVGAYM
jgi:hypothetical protein